MAFDSAAPINRRTVAKGIAWSVPAVAIASTAPAFATSHTPPPPVFDWALGCATTGSGGGCADLNKTPQVPFTITNNSGQTLQFQIVGQKSWNDQEDEPLAFSAPGGIYTNNANAETPCTPEVGITGCGGFESVELESGESASLWIVGSEMGAASAFWMKIQYRWITEDCATVVVPVTLAQPDAIIPNNNCS